MARKAHHDALRGLAQRLQEVGGDDLESHHPEHPRGEAQRIGTGIEQRGMAGEHAGDAPGEEVPREAAQGAHERAHSRSEPEGAAQTVVTLRTKVVAHNGLHTHAHAYHKGDDKLCDGGEDAYRRHARIAAIAVDGVVDDGVDDTPCRVDDARCGADGQDGFQDAPLRAVGARGEANLVALVKEVLDDEQGAHAHRQVGGDGGALDAPAQHEDEDGGQNHVEPGAYEHGPHGLGGIARGAHHVVVGIGDVVDDQARQDEHHEVVGIGQRGVAGAE